MMVGIADPEWRNHDYPHQLSGWYAPARDHRDGAGVQAKVLVADEPTTALDVRSIQAQILDSIRELQARLSLAASSLATVR